MYIAYRVHPSGCTTDTRVATYTQGTPCLHPMRYSLSTTLVHPLPTCWLCHALQVLGTPTLEEIQAMNQNYTEYKFPQARARPPLEAAAASPSVRKPRPSHLPPPPRSSRRSSRTRGTRSAAPARRRTPSSWSRASCAIRPTRASSPLRLARCPSSTSCATKACS